MLCCLPLREYNSGYHGNLPTKERTSQTLLNEDMQADSHSQTVIVMNYKFCGVVQYMHRVLLSVYEYIDVSRVLSTLTVTCMELHFGSHSVFFFNFLFYFILFIYLFFFLIF